MLIFAFYNLQANKSYFFHYSRHFCKLNLLSIYPVFICLFHLASKLIIIIICSLSAPLFAKYPVYICKQINHTNWAGNYAGAWNYIVGNFRQEITLLAISDEILLLMKNTTLVITVRMSLLIFIKFHVNFHQISSIFTKLQTRITWLLSSLFKCQCFHQIAPRVWFLN